jgi:hypothetical protein
MTVTTEKELEHALAEKADDIVIQGELAEKLQQDLSKFDNRISFAIAHGVVYHATFDGVSSKIIEFFEKIFDFLKSVLHETFNFTKDVLHELVEAYDIEFDPLDGRIRAKHKTN